MDPRRWISCTAVLAVLALPACAGFNNMLMQKEKSQHASSVMAYLYPEGKYERLETTAQIEVPANVGIAFVPEAGSARDRAEGLSEKEKQNLMQVVRDRFAQYDFINRIELVPTAYLRQGGSFDNVRQVAGMFDLDVMVLLSYDQIQFNDPKLLSLAYWTVIGLYTVKGQVNDTRTLLDAVVIDVASGRMLFRAPGTSQVEGTATALRQQETQREQSTEGFRLAAADLVENLDGSLAAFRADLTRRQDVEVVHRSGYTGSGALDAGAALLALGAVALAWRVRGG